MNCLALRFYIGQLVEFSSAASWTNFASSLPRLRTAEVGIPKRPGTTLAGTGSVSTTFAGFGVKQHAVVVVGQLLETAANADLPYVTRLKLVNVHTDRRGESCNFLLVDPDEAGCAGATITAF